MSNRAVVNSDFVVVGIGVTPRTEVFEAAGLATDNGLLVDEHLQTRSRTSSRRAMSPTLPTPSIGTASESSIGRTHRTRV